MKRLRIKHVTGFRYEGEVSASYNEARMLPVTGAAQLVLNSNLDVHPVSSHHQYTDYWGTRVLAFDVLAPHTELALTATSLVEVLGVAGPHTELDWAGLEAAISRSGECVQQLRQTPLTAPPDSVVELARELQAHESDPCSLARSVCETVGAAMEYMPGVTGVHSTAAEAWAEKRGVCQDITHIAIGALRSVGVPARYVSGYLHPSEQPVIGETVVGESHAWVEWFCGTWHAYDPTNLVEIGDRHVSVGHGRDYSDVAPLRGVYAGSHGSELFVRVEITREM